MLEDTSSLGQLSVKDHLVYVQGLLWKQGASVIGQGAPMTLHSHIPYVGRLGQRPHHQLSHSGLGLSAKEDDGQCLSGRWGAPLVQVGQGCRLGGQLQLD